MKVQSIGLSRFRRSKVLLASLLVGLLTTPAAMAGPEGGRVVRGDGNIVRPDATTTTVNQHTHNMVVDWNSFNVNVNETVNFNQPSANATALNQIWDQNASQILGSVNANGRIILVNPNGILFGRNASVDVGSLIASGLNIDTDQFMQGNWSFNADGNAGGLIVNQGLLRAANDGSVSLFGGAVQNSGTIIANYGAINLAAGETVTIDFDGDGLLQFAVDGDVLENAHGVDSAVANTGELIAQSGSILLSANAARDVFSQVVNNGGLIEAGGVETAGGRVFLTGSGGDVVSSGVIDASSEQRGGGFVQLESDATTLLDGGSIDVSSGADEGGEARVLGKRVGLFGAATIDASGATSGGEVLIGGDYQGGNAAVRNADYAFVGADAVIDAGATQSGDGGRVIVWSDQVTRFFGTIAAQGTGGGAGGFAEVSGFTLIFNGFVDLSGATPGTLLLDPENITIQDGGTETDLVGGTGDDGDPNTYAFAEDPASSVTIDADVLTGIMDGGTTVTLQAHDDITINEIIDASGSTTAGGGLTLQAGDDIFVNFDVLTNNGAITFTANDAGATPVAPDGTGDIVMADGVTIDAGTAAIVLSAEGDVALENLATTGTIDVTSTAGSIVQASADMLLSGSTVTLAAATDVGTSGAAINTAASNLDLSATAGDVVVAETDGVTLDAVSAGGVIDITSATGNMEIAGAVTATTTVDLTATAGSILDTAGTGSIAGTTVTLTAGTGVGASGAEIGTAADALDVSVTGMGDIFINETDGVDLADIDTFDGSVTVTAGGTITATDVAAGDNDVSNDEFISLTSTGGGIAAGVIDAGTAGEVTLDAQGGAITDDNGVTNNITADMLTADAAGGIDLDTTVASVDLSTSATGDIDIDEADALNLTAVDTSDGAIDIATTAGSIDIAGTVTATTTVDLTAGSAGSSITDTVGGNTVAGTTVTLIADTDIGNLAGNAIATAADTLDLTATNGDVSVADVDGVILDNLSAGGDSEVTAGGALTDSANATIAVTGNAVFGGTSITLGDTGTDAFNAGTLTFNSAGAVDITEDSAIVIAGTSTAGSLALDSTTGSITDSGSATVTVTDNAAFDGTSITLDDGHSFGTLTFNSGGAVNIVETDGTRFSGTSTADSVTLIANGAIDDDGTADVNVTNHASLNDISASSGVTLDDIYSFGSLSFSSGGAVSISEADAMVLSGLSTADSLALTSTTSITDDGTADLSIANNAAFDGTSIMLNDAGHDFGSLTFTSAGAVTIVQDSAMVLANNSSAGTLDLTANGSITDTGDVDVSGGTATFTAGAANDIVLNSATNDFGTVAVVSGNNVTLRDANGITLGAITASGALDVGAANGVTVNDAVVANGASTINADNDNNGTGTLTVSGTGSVDTTDNTLDIIAADVVLVGMLDSGTATTTITASNDGNLGVGSGAGALVLSDAELANITATGLTLFSTGTGVINVTGTTAANTGNFGALTLNGAGGVNVTGNTVFANDVEFTGGTTDLVADVTSTTGGLDFSSAVTVSGDSIATANTALNFDATITGGGTDNLDLSGDTVTVAGNISALATFDANGTTSVAVAGVATSGAQSYTGVTTLDGNVSSTNGDIVFNDDITVGANLSVTTGGSVTTAGVDATTNTISIRVDDDNNSTETLTVNGALTNDANISLTGGTDADDTLAAANQVNTWVIDGADDGTLNGAGFTDFANLTGGADDDTFQLVTGGSISGLLDGGAETGADVLDVSGIANETIFLSGSTDSINAFTDIEEFTGNGTTVLSGGSNWAINAQNAGTVDGVDFSGMSSIAGTAGADSFTFTGTGEITGSVDGLAGSDSINLSGYGSASTVTLTGLGGTDGFAGSETVIAAFDNIDAIVGATGQSNTLAGINAAASWTTGGTNNGTYTSTNSLAWTDFENLTGGNNVDTFNLGHNVSGTVAGGAGADDFNVSVTLAGALSGGANDDTFSFAGTVSVGGGIAGGAGSDTIDWSAYATGVNVVLNATGATDGFDGTGASAAFTDIDAVIGPAAQTNTLTGIDAAANWTTSGVDDGTYVSTNSLAWTDFENLTGGTNADIFNLNHNVTGTVSGGTGTDTLDYSGAAGPVTVDLQNATATSVGGNFAGIEVLVGSGNVGDTLIGVDDANTWTLTGANAGDVDGFTFSAVESLTGGSGADDFVFQAGGSVSGDIAGGAGTDTLDYSGVAGPVTVDLANATATSVGGNSTSIEALIGSGSTGDTLIGANDANAWTLTGADVGDVDGFTFSAVENLTGGTAVDTFDLAFDVTGTVTGGAGDDVFDYTDGVTIGALTGGTGSDTLNGDDVANTWTVSGANSGTLNTQAFSQIENLAGGTNTDDFVFQGGGSVAGNVNGGTGTDTLDYSGYTGGAVTVDLANGTATATGGFTSIEALIGSGNVGDTLIGANDANTWIVNADNAGSVDGFTFSAVENLTGGSDADQFNLSAGVTGTISGAGGADVIDVLASFTGPGTQLTLDAETVSNSGGGVITVDTLNIVGAVNVGAAGAELETDVTNLALAATGDAFIVETDALNISGSVGNDLTLDAGGAITQGTSLAVGGTADLQNTSGNITLNNAGNDFGTVLLSSSGAVTLRDATGIDLGTSDITGNLTLTAGGNVTDSGNLTVGGATTMTAAGSNITLDNANDFASIGVTAATNATINDVNALALATSNLTGNLTVTAGGALVLSDISGVNVLSLSNSGGTTLNGQLDVNSLDLGGASGSLLVGSGAGITTANTDVNLTGYNAINAAAGGGSLQIDAGTAAIFLPDVGATSALNNLSATAQQINLLDVTTNAGQSYTGTVSLNGNLDGGGAINISGPVNLAGNSGITASTIDIDGNVDGNRALTLSGDVTVSGDIGASTALQSLTAAGTAIRLEGSVTTSGTQTYDSAVTAHDNLTGGSLVFNDSLHFPSGAIVVSDTIDFNGGNGSVSGDGQLTLLPATADGTIDIGGNSGDLNINGAALNGYMGGLVIGGTYSPDQNHAVTNVARRIVVSDGIDTGTGSLALISTHGISLSNGTLRGGQLILIASHEDGTILNPGGNQTQLVSDEIILVSGSSIGEQGEEEIRARSASGAGVLQIASGAAQSAISDPANSLQRLIGREAPLAFAIASQFEFTINNNLLVTNSAQSSANREQGGGLTDEGFIDPSLFEDISLYEVLGTGIALPADQSEEGHFEEDECGPGDEDCDAGIDVGFVTPQ